MSTDSNRREAFRLDDSMMLLVESLENQEIDDAIDNFDELRLRHCLGSHFKLQKENRKTNLLMLRKRDPDVGKYLESLEEQLQLIADRLTDNERDSVKLEAHDVNLSNSSVRFETSKKYELGERVKLRMILSTSDVQVFSIATVSRVEQSENADAVNAIALQFTHIHADDEEALIRHMAKLQQLQLQARRAD